jgi:hypothetical protein
MSEERRLKYCIRCGRPRAVVKEELVRLFPVPLMARILACGHRVTFRPDDIDQALEDEV